MPPQPPTREATRGDALTERVAPDPDLKLKERETTFSFADDEATTVRSGRMRARLSGAE